MKVIELGDKSEISFTFLTKDNRSVFQNRLKKFDCDKSRYNRVVRNAPLDNVTTLLFVDTRNDDIIGYLSYCCANLPIKSVEDVYPALEIKTFAVAREYQDTLLKYPSSKGTPLCADFILKIGVDILKTISHFIVAAGYILVDVDQTNKTENFYKKTGIFVPLVGSPADHNYFFSVILPKEEDTSTISLSDLYLHLN